MTNLYDLTIIGGGPAGLSAAVNAASEGLKTLLIESSPKLGGQIQHSAAVENFLGYPLITGQKLINRAITQARKFVAEIRVYSPVTSIENDNKELAIKTAAGESFLSRSLIIASGLSWRKLEATNAEKFEACILYGGNKNMASKFKGKHVLIVGGGNSAGQCALQWARFCWVKLIARKPLEETMSQYLITRLQEAQVPVVVGDEVIALNGDKRLSDAKLASNDIVPCNVLIPFIGSLPRTDFAKDCCARDDNGYLIEPKIAGVFIAGDVRKDSTKRVAVAIGEGSAAVPKVHQYLAK